MRPVSVSPGGGRSFTPYTELAIGPAELVVAVGLVYSLAFLYLTGATPLSGESQTLVRSVLIAAIVPLLVTFVATVLFTTVSII